MPSKGQLSRIFSSKTYSLEPQTKETTSSATPSVASKMKNNELDRTTPFDLGRGITNLAYTLTESDKELSPQKAPGGDVELEKGHKGDDGVGENMNESFRKYHTRFMAGLVIIASFLCYGIVHGTLSSVGVLFVALLKILEEAGEENPASIASITLSLAIGMTFFLSVVAGVLIDKIGIRVTAVTGGVLATLGMYLSSICFQQPLLFTLTMGLLFGIGASLAYTPSLVILGHYFDKRLGLANGIVTAGSSIFTVIMTQILQDVIDNHGIESAFQILTGVMGIVILCGFTFKPRLPSAAPNIDDKPLAKTLSQKCHGFFGMFINFEIWKNKKYIIWALATPAACFGYFVPYVHLVAFAKDVLGDDINSQVLVQCIGGMSGIGRILFGLLADRPWVNRIVLQQFSLLCIGVLTMLLTSVKTFWVFVAISLGMGLFDGCFISLLGPIAFDIVGPSNASQAIGNLLAFCAIPLTVGPFVAGVMFDHLDSYLVPFICAGISPILGGAALSLIRFVKEPTVSENDTKFEDAMVQDFNSSRRASLIVTDRSPI